MTTVFDNAWTVIFALFTAVWAQVFIQLWDNRNERLKFKWNSQNDDSADQVRLDYENKANKFRSTFL